MDIEIRKYLKLVTRWWWLLVVGAVIPVGVSYYFASQQSDLYEAKATVMVGRSLQDPNPDPGQMDLGNTLAAAYAELIKQGPFLEAVIERLGLERTPAQLAAQVTTWVYSGAQLLEIKVIDTSPEAAALIANALADELIRRSPAAGGGDPEQQEFIRRQLEELQESIESINEQIDKLNAPLSELTSAYDLQDAQDRIATLGQVKAAHQATYAGILASYRAESPNALSLFDPAVVPQWPISSKTNLIVAVAGAAGLGLAVGAIFLMDYLDTSLRWEGEGVQSILELPVLGAVPRVSRKAAALSGSSVGPVAEGIRALRTNVFLMRSDHPFKTLLLTSPSSTEGKGFVLANLAVALASTGKRVITVDADMRGPSLHEFFDLPNVVGLADALGNDGADGENMFSVALQETGFDNLHLLSAGRPPMDPAKLLTSPRFPALLEFLKGQGDVILFDSSPVLGPPDATVLATLVEGTILVVNVGFTKRELLQQARDRLLAQRGVNLLGLAVNRAKLKGSSHTTYGSDQGDEESKQGMENDDKSWLTLGEAAERLGVGKAVARRWCRTGRLTKRWSVLGWRVSKDDVKRIAQQAQMCTGTVEGGNSRCQSGTSCP